MSHFSRIKTKMTEEEYVLAALKDMGMKYQMGDQKVRGFGNQTIGADIRIPLALSYDIGLRKVNGAYDIIADWSFVRGIKQKEFTEKLMQRYAYHATRAKLEQQGFDMVEEQVEETGQIRIVLRRMG